MSTYITHYSSLVGDLLLASKDGALIGIWLNDQRYYLGKFKDDLVEKNDDPILLQTKNWLDRYFDGKQPKISELKLNLVGTAFQKKVWQKLCEIPYGQVTTYKAIGDEIAQANKKVSYRAIGTAISHNPISIVVPCHRVIGRSGSLVGYAGGIENKSKLLQLEGNAIDNFKISKTSNQIKRCRWCNLKNPIYVTYHDKEWGQPNFDDNYLFEMLLLESFQAGLSWECILNKRESFRLAYDNFDFDKISDYRKEKIDELLANPDIIRNRLKIQASITNARIFKKIRAEFKTFHNYLKQFTDDGVIYENDKTSSNLSDMIAADLQKRGMKFVGTTIIYSYLQAIGVIYSHDDDCYLAKK